MTSTTKRPTEAALLSVVLAIALALRGGLYLLLLRHPDRYLQPDSHGYHALALSLGQGCFGVLTEAGVCLPETGRVPLYPALLAACYALFGPHPEAAAALQVVLSSATVALAYLLGAAWAGSRVGLLLAALLAVEAGSVLYANQIMAETLFGLVLLASVLAWSRLVREARWQDGLIAGLTLGLATLVRPVSIYLIVVPVLLTLWFRRNSASGRWLAVGALCLGHALVLTPWILRNATQAGSARVSDIQGTNLLFYNAAHLRAARQGVSFGEARSEIREEVRREAADLPRGELAAHHQRKALAEIGADLPGYAWVHAKGSAALLVLPTSNVVARSLGWTRTAGSGLLANLLQRDLGPSWDAFQRFRSGRQGGALFLASVVYEVAYLGFVYLLALLGVVRLVRRRAWSCLALALLTIGYFAAVTGPVGYDPRYRLPAMPLVLMLSAVGLAACSRRWSSKAKHT